ncbi:hypothetical protein C7212DRAFT_312738, partial [Tuber magnatum]
VDKQRVEKDFGGSKKDASGCDIGRNGNEKSRSGVGAESSEMGVQVGKRRREWEIGGRGEREDGETRGSI